MEKATQSAEGQSAEGQSAKGGRRSGGVVPRRAGPGVVLTGLLVLAGGAVATLAGCETGEERHLERQDALEADERMQKSADALLEEHRRRYD